MAHIVHKDEASNALLLCIPLPLLRPHRSFPYPKIKRLPLYLEVEVYRRRTQKVKCTFRLPGAVNITSSFCKVQQAGWPRRVTLFLGHAAIECSAERLSIAEIVPVASSLSRQPRRLWGGGGREGRNAQMCRGLDLKVTPLLCVHMYQEK